MKIGDILTGRNQMQYELIKFNKDGTINVKGLMFNKVYKNKEKHVFTVN